MNTRRSGSNTVCLRLSNVASPRIQQRRSRSGGRDSVRLRACERPTRGGRAFQRDHGLRNPDAAQPEFSLRVRAGKDDVRLTSHLLANGSKLGVPRKSSKPIVPCSNCNQDVLADPSISVEEFREVAEVDLELACACAPCGVVP